MAWTHGASTYRNSKYGCRCDRCRWANTERMKREIANRAARLAADSTLAPHGQVSTYRNWRCRCRPCTDAHSAQCREYERRRKERSTQ